MRRDPARYQAGDHADQARAWAYRRELRDSGVSAYEQLHTYAGWQDQTVQLLSLDRQYVKDLARDHVWRYDHSPARTREREQSMQRTLSLAMGERPEAVPRSPERSHLRMPRRDLLEEMQELTARLERLSGEQEQEQAHGAALNMRLHDRERDHGMGF